MQSSMLLLLCCAAYAAANPLMLLSYDVAESGDRQGRSSAFLRCRHPMPYYDALTKKLSYRCPTAPLKVRYEAVQDPQGNLELIETLVEEPIADPVVKVGHISELQEQAFGNGFGPAYATRAKKPCPDGQIFLSEIGVCVANHNKPKPKPSRPRTNKPLRVSAQQSDDSDESQVELVEPIIIRVVKGQRAKCADDEIFSSELGICLPINNCWPATACNKKADKDD